MSAVDLRAHIRGIPDFPKPGIVFRDITPLLLDPPALDAAVSLLADWARPRDVDLVVAAEARGFILGAAIARELGAGFVPARKPGKLPSEVVSVRSASFVPPAALGPAVSTPRGVPRPVVDSRAGTRCQCSPAQFGRHPDRAIAAS